MAPQHHDGSWTTVDSSTQIITAEFTTENGAAVLATFLQNSIGLQESCRDAVRGSSCISVESPINNTTTDHTALPFVHGIGGEPGAVVNLYCNNKLVKSTVIGANGLWGMLDIPLI
jgi:hypothetical protein